MALDAGLCDPEILFQFEFKLIIKFSQVFICMVTHDSQRFSLNNQRIQKDVLFSKYSY